MKTGVKLIIYGLLTIVLMIAVILILGRLSDEMSSLAGALFVGPAILIGVILIVVGIYRLIFFDRGQ